MVVKNLFFFLHSLNQSPSSLQCPFTTIISFKMLQKCRKNAENIF